nr:transposase [Allobaculum sp. JKK-2023]
MGIMCNIKSGITFTKFLSRMTSLWTRSYFVSTAGQVSAETVQHYVKNQKTR